MPNREERIQALAYDIWERSGRPKGQELAHWAEAERIIDEQDSVASQAPMDPKVESPGRA